MDADLMSIGQHCAVAECRQNDFLPFRCDCCSNVYCLEHRTYAAHSCSKSGTRQTEVIVCPLCAKGIRVAAGQDVNQAFERHTATDCDPTNYAKVHKKPRCPVGNCREKLTTINTYHCKSCNQKVCLKHRHEDDHGCQQAKAKQAAAVAAQRTQLAQARAAAQPVPKPAPKPQTLQQIRAVAAKQYEDPGNSVKGTAHRRMLGTPTTTTATPSATVTNPLHQQRATVPTSTSNANPLVPPHLPEVCPQCQARFASVDKLVQHVEEWHPTAQSNPAAAAAIARAGQGQGWGSQPQTTSSSSSDLYRCHRCQRGFMDPVALVQHSEQCGAGAQSTATAGGGGARKQDCVVS
mmetsp:Transcript_14086/g.30539  ORF Transcript_14086/g.30539 Transcript_14086/m.30539 type:complete len:349 (+) Transcript_14086:170-1216(+)